ncbi:MAG TPA: glycosyltransferase family 2 protein [Candidatus Scalindua sp.]|nr:glycosyltransferase family 2 protein [Candidatus Scalindua sp.]
MKGFKGKLSILVPAHNEGPHIYGNIREIQRVFNEIGCQYELIIIDDGSTDETYGNIQKAAKGFSNIIVKKIRRNQGKGRALKYGFRFAKGDLVAFLDADLDLHPEQIQYLFKIMNKDRADVVIGSKRHPESKLDYPRQRKFISHIYFLVIKSLFSLPIKDTQTGLKLFKYEVLKKVFPKVLVKRYAFDLELLVNIHHLGYKIVEAPITLNYQRIMGRIRLKDLYHTGMDTLAIFYRMHILRHYDR